MAKEVTLLGTCYSPFSRRVELALRLKGVEFEYIKQDLRNKSPLLLESNPVHKKVPVLLHNGKPLAESTVILQYIDETWPSSHPLLPKDRYERAKTRFWTKFVDETMHQTAVKIMKATEKELGGVLEEICQQLELLENELKGKEFFGGEAIGLVDIVAFYLTYLFQITQEITGRVFFREETFPELYKWLAKLREMEAVKACLAPRDKHVAHVRSIFEAMKAASR